jgi:predicted nucleotidyltransferase
MGLTATEQAALDAHVRELRRVFGNRLERVILFGSKVRGDDHEQSDVDLLVVLTDEVSLADEELASVSSFDLLVEQHVYIHNILIPHADFEHPHALTYFVVSDAREEGVAV